MSEYNVTGSKICDKGVVASLFQENTFTLMDSFIELYQNSDDANSENVSFKIINFDDMSYLEVKDDGDGMTLKEMDDSLKLLQRGGKEKKHGKFNFGGKAGTLYISGIQDYINHNSDYDGTIITISKSNNENKAVGYIMNGIDIIENGWAGSRIFPTYYTGSKLKKMPWMDLYDYSPIKKGTSIYIQLTNKTKEELEDLDFTNKIIKDFEEFAYESLQKITLKIDFGIEKVINFNDIMKYDDIDDGKKEIINIKYFKDEYDRDLFVFNGELYAPRGASRLCINVKKYEPSDGDIYMGTITMIQVCPYIYNKEGWNKSNNDNDIRLCRSGCILNKYKATYPIIKITNKSPNKGKSWNYSWSVEKNIANNIKSIIKYDACEHLDKLFNVNMHKSDIKWDNIPIALNRTIAEIQIRFYNKVRDYIQIKEFNPRMQSMLNITTPSIITSLIPTGIDYKHLPKFKSEKDFLDFLKTNLTNEQKLLINK